MRLFSRSVAHTVRPRTGRKVFGLVCFGGAVVQCWKWNQAVTPADAEALALKHAVQQREIIDRIEKQASWKRLLQLLWIASPIVLIWPLWIVAPGLFWALVAKQIDRSGPCFIKLAQWLSTRRDLFSDELCESLSVMHESVEAKWSKDINPKDIKGQLESAEFPIKSLEDVATSSGSIAQVYFGELDNGTQIAVKCLRPGVQDLLENDLAWMLRLGAKADNHPNFRMLGLRRAAEEFCEHVQMQVDFEIEANNLRRFRANFANSGEVVRFPTPLYVDKSVLVLTRELGENMAHVFRTSDDIGHSKLQAKRAELKQVTGPGLKDLELIIRSESIAEVLGVPHRTVRMLGGEILASYMRMLFNDAFIHGDLHPGNMMVRLNDGAYVDNSGSATRSGSEVFVGGWRHHIFQMLPDAIRTSMFDCTPPFELVLLDAGLAIPIAPKAVESLRSMAVSMLYNDFLGSARHIYNMSPDSSKCKDPEAFVSDLASVFQKVRGEIKESGYLQVSDACLECLRLVRYHQVVLETGPTWALFAMLSAEGSARQLDQKADCTGAAARYIVSVPSLFREFNKQQPSEIVWKMCRELIFGRNTQCRG